LQIYPARRLRGDLLSRPAEDIEAARISLRRTPRWQLKKFSRSVNNRTDVAGFSCFNVGVLARIDICIRPAAGAWAWLPGYCLISRRWCHAASPIFCDARNVSSSIAWTITVFAGLLLLS